MHKIEQQGQIKAYLNKGNQLKKEGKLNQAIEQYQKALQVDPGCVPALAQLSRIYESRKKLDSAINYLQKLVQLKPNNQNFFSRLMAIHSKVLPQKDNIDKVIAAYQEFTQINSEKLLEKAHEFWGDFLLQTSTRQGQIDRTTTFFQEAIENNPNSPWLHYNLGLTLAKQDRLDEAVRCYRKAIEIQPEFWQAYAELGICLRKKGKKNAAFQCSKKAFALHPNLSKKYMQHLDMKSPKNWEAYQNTFKEISETTNTITTSQYYTFAKQLSQKGEFSEAIYYCKKALHYKLKKSKPEFVNQYWDAGQLQEPNFLITGVAKCGTTALYSYLSQHPKLLPAVVKEPQYLSSLVPKIKGIEEQGDWSLLNSEKDFYLAHFPPRPKDGQFITGEASTRTIWSKSETIVKNWFPNIKLIAILRNPIKRAISHYNFSIQNKKSSLEQMLNSELEELENMTDLPQQIESLQHVRWGKHLAPGLYLYYLKRWMNLFPREQFLILTNEDLAQNPAGVMKQTFDFLGLPEYDGINYTPRNVGSYPKDIDPDLLSRLKDFYRPHNQRLEEFLGRKLNWD